MRKVPDPRTVYMYLVCFLALIALVTGVVRAGGAAIELVMAADSDLNFLGDTRARMEWEYGVSLPDEILSAQTEFETGQSGARTHVESELVRALAVFLVAGPIYVYHWRLLKREERTSRPPSHWGPRPLYFLLVSLAALIMVFSASGNLLDNISGVARPRHVYATGPAMTWVNMAEAERDAAVAIAQAEREYQRVLEQRSRWHLVRATQNGLLLAVGAGLYALHWPVARRGFDH